MLLHLVSEGFRFVLDGVGNSVPTVNGRNLCPLLGEHPGYPEQAIALRC